MNIESSEDFSCYSSKITICSNDSLSDIIKYIRELPEIYSNSSGALNISFIIDEYVDYEGDCFEELINALENNTNFNKWSATDVEIYITIEKPENELIIYDEQLLVSELESYDIYEQFELVQSHFSIFNDDTHTFNIEQLKAELNTKCRSVVFPEAYQNLIDSYTGPIKDYLVSLKNLTCFCLLTEKVEYSDGELFVYISDSHIIDISEIKSLNQIQINTLQKVYDWVFEDDFYRTRRLVLNRIFSFQSSVVSSLNDRLIPILKSNLNIVLSENFDSYVQSRNSILDFNHELTNKLNLQVSELSSSYANAFILVVSFLFSSIVFTSIDKGKFVNILTDQVVLLIYLLLFAASFYISIKQFEVEESLNHHLQQRDEFKEKYLGVLSEEELESLFRPPSLIAIVNRLRSRGMMYFYQCVFLLIGIMVSIVKCYL
ncbi:hypothetical protein ACOQ0N_004459 [Vibrio parahaemolyticus]|uniref:hypothetical protein n=1 Tax=Vibrio parahaemolyticus TaxID=670 RepID=UPI00111F7D13|nr:hypothetical protein [Vibrio parahaemolyticus]EKN4606508.1 hypothetical protein [Vibrio parahaemolyticus]MBE3865991.1 hypothetical protein [Vibrio parahaemolyticus]MBE4091654.1 hypothetical protein [Vibrio parahaemolyticus]MBE4335773.1 hypothetical protein [Vibrio parahaemolyticus]MBE4357698.1 hypothetical protein [Vibrio parahaemolyticus]